MSPLRLTFAGGIYDRTEPLRHREVAVKDVDLQFVMIDSPRDIFDRMGGKQEFDASEFSSSEFISRAAAAGRDCPFVALPVFPARVFRHGYIYVNRKAGIRTPKDLEGKRVGVALYTMTAAVWIRGHLAHQFGVDLSTIQWVEGAILDAGRHGEPAAPPLLKPARIEHDPAGRSLSELLAAGEIDALTGTQHPTPHPDIAPLFPDAHAVEREFYRQTRIFPIMHLVVIRRDVHEKNPWLAQNLYEAFVESKKLALKRMHKGHPYMLPWVHDDIHEIDEVFGGDPYPYGIEPNRPTLSALVQYLHEQNFIPRAPALEELFVTVKTMAP
ncbi:MAG: 4,5-dihydroxyphthalate decarboxylase [Alphaproteobacteria bacterium]|nr:4,5-dihydroxyphthalate decarboxylase [Alphaproteobacteria bacterium]